MQANKKSTPDFVRAGDAVSKQRKFRMMPTVNRNLEAICCIKSAESQSDANKNHAGLKCVVGIKKEFCPDDAAFFPDYPVIIIKNRPKDTA